MTPGLSISQYLCSLFFTSKFQTIERTLFGNSLDSNLVCLTKFRFKIATMRCAVGMASNGFDLLINGSLLHQEAISPFSTIFYSLKSFSLVIFFATLIMFNECCH